MSCSGTIPTLEIGPPLSEMQYIEVVHQALHKGIIIQLNPIIFDSLHLIVFKIQECERSFFFCLKRDYFSICSKL